MSWSPRKPKWPWRDFLTEDEADEVRSYERKIATAKYEMAMAQPALQLLLLLSPDLRSQRPCRC
jgi:hypothetical protein